MNRNTLRESEACNVTEQMTLLKQLFSLFLSELKYKSESQTTDLLNKSKSQCNQSSLIFKQMTLDSLVISHSKHNTQENLIQTND